MSEGSPLIFFAHGNPRKAVQNTRYPQDGGALGNRSESPRPSCRFRRTGLCLEPGSRSVRRQRRFTISAVFPANCTKCNTQLREIPIWHAVLNSCWPRFRCNWTTPGVWITEPGPYSVTFTRVPMFPWCS